MKVFVRIADSKSFSSTAALLRRSPGQISRSLAILEKHLNARLMNRNTRHVALTEAGERYLGHCRKILADLEFAKAEILNESVTQIPSGVLRIHSMTSFGLHYIMPLVAKFVSCFPQIKLELTLAQRPVDILDAAYDGAIQLVDVVRRPDVASWRIGDIACILCGAPGYLAAHGVPRHPSDLKTHTCLHLRMSGVPFRRWQFNGPNGVENVMFDKYPFVANTATAVAMAIEQDMGIGVIPAPFALEGLRKGTIRRLLPAYGLPAMSIELAYPAGFTASVQLSAWINFLRTHLPERLASEMNALSTYEPDL